MTDAAAATLILDNYLVKNKKNNMEQITYDDFAKLQIKIGTILSVEIVKTLTNY